MPQVIQLEDREVARVMGLTEGFLLILRSGETIACTNSRAVSKVLDKRLPGLLPSALALGGPQPSQPLSPDLRLQLITLHNISKLVKLFRGNRIRLAEFIAGAEQIVPDLPDPEGLELLFQSGKWEAAANAPRLGDTQPVAAWPLDPDEEEADYADAIGSGSPLVAVEAVAMEPDHLDDDDPPEGVTR